MFSIYRRSSEVPLYRVEKEPQLARKQGAYSVVVASGLILKRGHDLGLCCGLSTGRSAWWRADFIDPPQATGRRQD